MRFNKDKLKNNLPFGVISVGLIGILAFALTTSEEPYEINLDEPVTVVDFEEEETTRIIDDFYIGATNMSRKVAVEPFIEIRQCENNSSNRCSNDYIPFPQKLVGTITVGDTIVLENNTNN